MTAFNKSSCHNMSVSAKTKIFNQKDFLKKILTGQKINSVLQNEKH